MKHMSREARRAGLFGVVVFVGALSVADMAGCTPGQRQGARTAIDALTAACIIANAALPDDRVKQVCGIVDAFDGPMKDLLKASREQVAKARAEGAGVGCSRDAGGE